MATLKNCLFDPLLPGVYACLHSLSAGQASLRFSANFNFQDTLMSSTGGRTERAKTVAGRKQRVFKRSSGYYMPIPRDAQEMKL